MGLFRQEYFSTQYVHGSMVADELSIRGWTLIQKFPPDNPRTLERLNGFKSRDNRVHNHFISPSLGGYLNPPQNPK